MGAIRPPTPAEGDWFDTQQPQTTSAPSPQGGGGGDVRAAIDAYLAQFPTASREAYEGLFPHLQSLGFNVQRPTRAGGTANSDDKIVLPDGSVIDLIMDVGPDGSGRWGWSHNGYWVDGKPSATQGVYTPFDANPDSGGMGGGGFNGSSLTSLGYNPGASIAPWNEQFKPPTMTDDPGYQFRLGEGLKSIERGAAAKGTLLTGGTLKGLQNYAQGLASQEYGQAYDRGLGQYMLKRDNFFQNQDRPFEKFYSLGALGRPA